MKETKHHRDKEKKKLQEEEKMSDFWDELSEAVEEWIRQTKNVAKAPKTLAS